MEHQQPPPPNPFIIGDPHWGPWHCPICGGSTVRYGVEKRRVGRRPWKRLVHVDC